MKSFNPPKRLLLGPGPSNLSPRVSNAMSQSVLGHLDPDFVGMMDEVKAGLQYVMRTENPVTLAISGPGSAAMEMAIVNMIEPGEKAIICQNGYFSSRMREMIVRNASIPVDVIFEWGKAIDLTVLEDTIEAHPDAKVVCVVFAETSTGVQADLKSIADLCHKYNRFLVADAVPALGGSVIKVDEWGIDVLFSGSQKCLSCTPGVSPITFSDRAVERIKNRNQKVMNWFYDISSMLGYWGGNQKRTYHHTAPIHSLYALHETLCMIQEEGIENRWKRHVEVRDYAHQKFAEIGLNTLVPKEIQMPQLHPVLVPEGMDDLVIRKTLLNEFGIELGAGLGPFAGKIWRIGFMGENAHTSNVDFLVNALQQILVKY
ncbi:alanine--glyoxylate aminotransferase family protein [bacterium]|nr:MAG: alanine--glyoxylate aminotransferase family protein [bacterium]